MQNSYFICPMCILVIFLPQGYFKSMAYFGAQIIFSLLESFDIYKRKPKANTTYLPNTSKAEKAKKLLILPKMHLQMHVLKDANNLPLLQLQKMSRSSLLNVSIFNININVHINQRYLSSPGTKKKIWKRENEYTVKTRFKMKES